MTDRECTTPGCEYPHPEGQFVCKICVQQLKRDLGDIPALIDDLHTTMSRQDKLGASSGRRGGETALPWKPPASEALWVLIDTVLVWTREVMPAAEQPFPDAPIAAGRWLLTNVNSIASHADAGTITDEIASAVRRAYEVIDRPPDKLLAGKCDSDLDDGGRCVDYLYAHVDTEGKAARIARCRTCGAEHSFEERRAWMLGAAAELQLPAHMALAWVKLLMGKSIPDGTWRSWVSRRRIVPHDRDHVGNPLYRFGDIRDLAAEWVARPKMTKETAA